MIYDPIDIRRRHCVKNYVSFYYHIINILEKGVLHLLSLSSFLLIYN